ncbi:transferrin-binding protein-like solute binding protein [Yoonia sp. SS1-5]|uniref:Transferrin-binding protein-like solute binding protein n=1 Tax=Yoonia rhodophyticola TaxID=3137370 RepID=A0AAN0MC37_9RHOB
MRVWWVFVVVALAGCMSGGGPEASRLILAPATTGPQANGLAYGTSGQALQAAEGITISALAAGFSDQSAPVINTQPITFDAGFFDTAPAAQGARVRLFGQDVVIENGQGRLANGQIVRIFYDPTRAGTYAGVVQLASYAALTNPAPSDPINGEVHSVIGFMTDPQVMDARISGNVTYQGDFTATGIAMRDGVAVGDPTGTELDGSATFTVEFGQDYIAGTITGTYQADDQAVDVGLEMVPTAFLDNNFGGALTCGATPACTGEGRVDGAFYGPQGQEIGAVVAVDVEQDVADRTYEFSGVGSFVIGPKGP